MRFAIGFKFSRIRKIKKMFDAQRSEQLSLRPGAAAALVGEGRQRADDVIVALDRAEAAFAAAG